MCRGHTKGRGGTPRPIGIFENPIETGRQVAKLFAPAAAEKPVPETTLRARKFLHDHPLSKHRESTRLQEDVNLKLDG
jgi:hypothetical protein